MDVNIAIIFETFQNFFEPHRTFHDTDIIIPARDPLLWVIAKEEGKLARAEHLSLLDAPLAVETCENLPGSHQLSNGRRIVKGPVISNCERTFILAVC